MKDRAVLEDVMDDGKEEMAHIFLFHTWTSLVTMEKAGSTGNDVVRQKPPTFVVVFWITASNLNFFEKKGERCR